MKFSVNDFKHISPPPLSIRCPHCGHQGTFESVGLNDLFIKEEVAVVLGQRKCPNLDCHGHVFVIYLYTDNTLISVYPPELIDFNREGIPDEILKIFEETLICHSNKCYTAAGMMVRRTLEEICHLNGAEGKNLQKRIESFEDKITVPPTLIKGMDNIRLLGNDAAHTTIKDFENVGKDEVEIAIEFTKLILTAIYKYKNILQKFEDMKKRKEPQ